MCVRPVRKAFVPRGITVRSSSPITAASSAPTMPMTISQWAPRANAAGSSPNAAMRSKTMLATQAPIGIVTRIGWKGCPYGPARTVRGRFARSRVRDVDSAVMSASLRRRPAARRGPSRPYGRGPGAATGGRADPAPTTTGRSARVRRPARSSSGVASQRSAWNIHRCFSRAPVTPMSRSWLTTSVCSVSLIASRSRPIVVPSARTK